MAREHLSEEEIERRLRAYFEAEAAALRAPADLWDKLEPRLKKLSRQTRLAAVWRRFGLSRKSWLLPAFVTSVLLLLIVSGTWLFILASRRILPPLPPTPATGEQSPLPKALPAPGVVKAPEVSSEPTRKLAVMGEGKVAYMPDIALLDLGIEVQRKTATEANNQAGKAMNRLIEVLKAQEVAEKDIQTIYFSLQPVYEHIKDQPPQLTGYKVVNKVRVKVRHIGKVGPVIDASVEALGDLVRIDRISFTIEDMASLYERARELAVRDAQAKAQQLASLLRITLGTPLNVSEYIAPIPYPPPFPLAIEAKELPTPIFPGEQEIRATVQIEYSIE